MSPFSVACVTLLYFCAGSLQRTGAHALGTDVSAVNGAESRLRGRQLKISDEVCQKVCETSEKVVGKIDLSGALQTRNCFGADRLKSCCMCLEQGYQWPSANGRIGRGNRTNSGGSPQPAFMHVCIPTTPRILDGKDIDFLHIMLKSLEEQVLEQADSGQGFGGVRFHISAVFQQAVPVTHVLLLGQFDGVQHTPRLSPSFREKS